MRVEALPVLLLDEDVGGLQLLEAAERVQVESGPKPIWLLALSKTTCTAPIKVSPRMVCFPA
mgnify:CR=1 FL=1